MPRISNVGICVYFGFYIIWIITETGVNSEKNSRNEDEFSNARNILIASSLAKAKKEYFFDRNSDNLSDDYFIRKRKSLGAYENSNIQDPVFLDPIHIQKKRIKRTPGLKDTTYVSSNGLDAVEPIDDTEDDYDYLMKQFNGDFGIKSAVIVAASQEPEYKGSGTVVLPLYIPKGAVPIRLTRIQRSGNLEDAPGSSASSLLDLKIGPTSDNVFFKRTGSPGGGPRIIAGPRIRNPIPPRQFWHRPLSGPSGKFTANRRTDSLPTRQAVKISREPITAPPNVSGRYGEKLRDAGEKTKEIEESVNDNEAEKTESSKSNAENSDDSEATSVSTTTIRSKETPSTASTTSTTTTSTTIKSTTSTEPSTTTTTTEITTTTTSEKSPTKSSNEPSSTTTLRTTTTTELQKTTKSNGTTVAPDITTFKSKDPLPSVDKSENVSNTTTKPRLVVRKKVITAKLPSTTENSRSPGTILTRADGSPIKRMSNFFGTRNRVKDENKLENEKNVEDEHKSSSENHRAVFKVNKNGKERQTLIALKPVKDILKNSTVSTTSKIEEPTTTSTTTTTTTTATTESTSTTTTTTPKPSTTTETSTTTKFPTIRYPWSKKSILKLNKTKTSDYNEDKNNNELTTNIVEATTLKSTKDRLSLIDEILGHNKTSKNTNKSEDFADEEIQSINDSDKSNSDPDEDLEISELNSPDEISQVKSFPAFSNPNFQNLRRGNSRNSTNKNNRRLPRPFNRHRVKTPTSTNPTVKLNHRNFSLRYTPSPNASDSSSDRTLQIYKYLVNRNISEIIQNMKQKHRSSTTISSAITSTSPTTVTTTVTTTPTTRPTTHRTTSSTATPTTSTTSSSSTNSDQESTSEIIPSKSNQSASTRYKTMTPEEIVLDSLTQIMKGATNRTNEKLTEIAADIDTLNKELAARGIIIIRAEIDGRQIKLRSAKDFNKRIESTGLNNSTNSNENTTEKTISTSINHSLSYTTKPAIDDFDISNSFPLTTGVKTIEDTTSKTKTKFSIGLVPLESTTNSLGDTDKIIRTSPPLNDHRLTPSINDSNNLHGSSTIKSISSTATHVSSIPTKTRSTTVGVNSTETSFIRITKDIPNRINTSKEDTFKALFDNNVDEPKILESHHEDAVTSETYPSGGSNPIIYISIVVIILPLIAIVTLFVKRHRLKSIKALPDHEEHAEGFTPITHHHPRKSVPSPIIPRPDLKFSDDSPKSFIRSPWEFPRSDLRLVSILGEGNFGIVWKAEARNLCGRSDDGGGPTVLVAVKGVKEGACMKEKQDLIQELTLMKELGQHPNVVTLLGCCTKQEPHLVIMEYVMWGKLLTFLRDHRSKHNYYNFSSDTEHLTSQDLSEFACQIATGCDYLQSRGIIHRDLAARNILVDHKKICKIADFGLARNVKDLGTDIYEQKSKGALPIRWMAPESLYMNIFTHKSDVWSFGILVWEIVTLGSTPYPGLSARDVMRQVREGYRLERPEHCKHELYHIVKKCWHQDLNERPSFSELKVELAELIDHESGYIDLENFPESSYFSMLQNPEEKL